MPFPPPKSFPPNGIPIAILHSGSHTAANAGALAQTISSLYRGTPLVAASQWTSLSRSSRRACPEFDCQVSLLPMLGPAALSPQRLPIDPSWHSASILFPPFPAPACFNILLFGEGQHRGSPSAHAVAHAISKPIPHLPRCGDWAQVVACEGLPAGKVCVQRRRSPVGATQSVFPFPFPWDTGE
eukprot:GGOE01028467.1.p1 GENE.GGOE01028467.1~~GGOE01028467.1.p1  ORF type:complete len:184 (+),score=4.51 GGOE01028467.1:834-1385(+)